MANLGSAGYEALYIDWRRRFQETEQVPVMKPEKHCPVPPIWCRSNISKQVVRCRKSFIKATKRKEITLIVVVEQMTHMLV